MASGDRKTVLAMDEMFMEGGKPPTGGIFGGMTAMLPPKIDKKRLARAWIFLGAMVLNWVIMAELIQIIEHKFYNKPLFMTWFAHCSGILWLLVWGYLYLKQRKAATRMSASALSRTLPTASSKQYLITGVPLKQMLLSALALCFAIFFVEYLSLPRISVTVNTAIQNSGAAFVFMFSYYMLRERVTFIKLISVGVCLIGVFVVSLSGGAPLFVNPVPSSTSELLAPAMGTTPSPTAGYVLAILSTIGYAFYQVAYRKYAVDPEEPYSIKDTCFFLGLVGLFNLLLVWPLIPIWNMLGFETHDSPSANVLLYLIVLGLLDASQNFLILLAIIYSSPLFVSIGTLLTIPTAILFDVAIYRLISYLLPGEFCSYVAPFIGFVGISFILFGFLLLNYGEVASSESVPASIRFLFAERASMC